MRFGNHKGKVMMHCKLTLTAVALLGLTAAPSMASLSKADQTFAQKAAQGGMAEVSLGQLAEQNAASPQVKQFGERMVTDHTQANQALRQIAQQENIDLPTQPASKDQATQRRLSGLKGSAFDAAYSHDMVQDHKQDIAEFQKEAQSGQDPALKQFARKTLPTLQQHLQMAQAIQAQK